MTNPFDWIFFLLNSQNNHFFRLHQKVSVEMLTQGTGLIFIKNVAGACTSQTDLLHLLAYAGHILEKRCCIAAF